MKSKGNSRIDRRKFLELSAKTLALVSTAPAIASFLPKSSLAAGSSQSRPDLVVCHGDSAEGLIKRAIEELGGMKRFIVKGDSVVIKPNMAFATPPEWGNNTNPLIAAALARLCMEAGAGKVTVIDYPQGNAQKCYERNGVARACEAIGGVKTKYLSGRDDFKKVSVPKGRVLKEVEIAKDILQADLLINLPVAKAHSFTKVSLGIKNYMGLIYDRVYFHKMVEINQALADLSTLIKPKLTIIDATRCMTTNGPDGPGETVEPKSVIASVDPVAADAYAVSVAKWDRQSLLPSDIGYVRLAGDLGLGKYDLAKLNIKKVKV